MVIKKKKVRRSAPKVAAPPVLPEGLTPEDVEAAAKALDAFEAEAGMPLGTLPDYSFWGIEDCAMAAMVGQFNEYVAANGIKIPEGQLTRPKRMVINGVEIVDISGPLSKRMSFFSFLFGGSSTMDIRRQIRAAVADADVNSIILRIDSPGGQMMGIKELSDDIFNARAVKPIVAQVDGVMASAALNLGSQATKVFANQSDLVGSIGVIRVVTDVSEQAASEGIKVTTVDTGPFKGAEVPGTEVTAQHIDHFQHIVDSYFAIMFKDIQRGRGFKSADLRAIADGRIFMGIEAVGNGLVDGIQPIEVTIAQVIREATPTGRSAGEKHLHHGMSLPQIRVELEKLKVSA